MAQLWLYYGLGGGKVKSEKGKVKNGAVGVGEWLGKK